MSRSGPTEAQLRALFENSAHGWVFTDAAGAIQFHNEAAASLFGSVEGGMVGLPIGALLPAELGIDDADGVVAPPNFVLAFAGAPLDVRARRRDGTEFIAETTISRIDMDGVAIHALELRDVSARMAAERERERLMLELASSHKLESVGRLAAGIAHEINTPVQYVGDNLQFLRESVASLQQVIETYRATPRIGSGEDLAAALSAGDRLADDLDLDYLTVEMPRAIAQALEGTTHIADIVSAMKAYCHPGRPEKEPIDLNAAIKNAVNVSRNEWKYVTTVEFELDQELPNVVCNENEIKQVLLNLIVNAAHAIEEKHGRQAAVKGTIRVLTRRTDQAVEIEVTDNGSGIPEHAMPRMFDPFFTTKEVGKGTGQGLAIAHSIIVDHHCGDIVVRSAPGQGTTFILRLPQ